MDWNKLLTKKRIRPSMRQDDARSAFESDFGRITFSPATRRMHAKTQVFPLTDDDNIHSRLTHSLEVMALGYSFSILFCESPLFQKKTGKSNYELFREIPVILKNGCLIHDIGNPPFGHFGETVIQEYFRNLFNSGTVNLQLTDGQRRDFEHFDGNAQGLRVLTKLQNLNDCFGLNLTCTTLASCLKYPNFGPIDKSRLETKKVGIFQSEIGHARVIAEQCGLLKDDRIIRHPLCYLVEASDSICYLTMDLEDGFKKGLYTLQELKETIESDFPEISTYLSEEIPDSAKITKIRNRLIGKLVNLSYQNFEEHIEEIEEGTFNRELVFSSTPLSNRLQKFCIEKIFSINDIYHLEMVGHSVLTWLLDFYIQNLFCRSKEYRDRTLALMSESILRTALDETGATTFDDLSDYYKLRVIVDNIAGMTDRFALKTYRELSGRG